MLDCIANTKDSSDNSRSKSNMKALSADNKEDETYSHTINETLRHTI